ncbi:hypothetical protein CUR178_06025 [Leishmania enriettii]|uniref:Uncharacterized protein n=1 Tax=Leishmania enriettii TaxID=5663 RepID=A0A836KPM2_LEIEN|nr:hypothetical protein CUR178_06025 [Leishmania enriettii]
MASYCEVCQGLYDTPHPHSRPQRSPWSSPPCKQGAGNLVYVSSSPSKQEGSGRSRGSRRMSWPRVARHYRDTPHASRSPFLDCRRSGPSSVGPCVRPGQQRRTASMPAVPGFCDDSTSPVPRHSPLHFGRHGSPDMDNGAEYNDEQYERCRCTTSIRFPLSTSETGGRGGSPGIERYREDTYCSQRRADGHPPQREYLRRRAEHGCTYVPPHDGRGGDGESSWLALDDFDGALLSSSFSLHAPAGAQAAAAPHRRCISAGRSPHASCVSSPYPCSDARRGGELGSRTLQHSSSSLARDDATGYASEYAAQLRSRHNTRADHTSERVSSAADAGSRHGTRMPSPQNATGAGESPSSQRPPLLPTATSMAPASPFVGPTFTAEPRAQASVSAATQLHHNRDEDSTWQPQISTDPLPSRPRDSLAHLVSKIRAEVSRDTVSWASGPPGAERRRSLADEKPRAAAEKRKRHRWPDKLQEQAHPSGMASPAEQASHAQDTTLPCVSFPETSTEAEGAVIAHPPITPHSTTGRGEGGLHANQSSTTPPAARERACGARSRRRHGSSRKRCCPSRPQRSSSSSLSAWSTQSSSSVRLRSTVKRAEAVLHRLQDRSRGSRALSPSSKNAKVFLSDLVADDAAVDAAPICGCQNSSMPASARRQDCTGSHSRSASGGNAAPPLLSRRHVTRVPSRRSSPSAPTDAFWGEDQGAPQRMHASNRVAREVQVERGDTSAVKQAMAEMAAESRRQQEMWNTTQEHRIERLREGLSALCAAVRKDLHKVREEVGRVRAEAHGTTEDGRKRMRDTLAAALRPDAPAESAATARMQRPDLCPSSVVTAVAQCAPEDQRRLAALLLPHLRPLLGEMVQEEVQQQLRLHRREQQEAQHALEQRLRAYAEEASVSQQRRTHAEETGGGEVGANAPIWAACSSAEAFDAHLRAAARAVLLEEDDRRYSLVNENERRHERRVQQLQQGWQETLSTAQAKWKAEWKAILEKESNAWTHRARAPLQQHADMLQDIVKALTRDVTHLQEQQEALSTRLVTSLRQEREMRMQEQTQLSERVEQRVRELLPREVESTCVRFHALREQRLAVAASRASAAEPVSPGTSGQCVASTTSAAAAPSAASSVEELRLSIVQPAMEHMRRLLALHQEMIDSTVEDRCRRAEHTVEGHRRWWAQNVAELRAKLSALRTDVRGALGELCENLNVASPVL